MCYSSCFDVHTMRPKFDLLKWLVFIGGITQSHAILFNIFIFSITKCVYLD